MSMTDPIADFLTRLRNGIRARHTSVVCPRSNLKARLAEILKEEGYIDEVALRGEKQEAVIAMTLRYNDKNVNAISGLRRASRPGQRLYVGAKDVPKVRNGLGIAIISTSNGVMTDREARKQGVGGEVICEVW